MRVGGRTIRKLSLLAVTAAILSVLFNNCARVDMKSGSAGSSKAASGGDIYSGMTYIARLGSGVCADGSNISAIIKFDANKVAKLLRFDCVDRATPEVIPSAEIVLRPEINQIVYRAVALELDPKSAVLNITGSAPSAAAIEAKGGFYAQHEQNFRAFADSLWASEGTAWSTANEFDRAKIYYVWWARSGNGTYLDRANALALSYRKNHVEASGYAINGWTAYTHGLALHYRVTGDNQSRIAVGKIADSYSTSPILDSLATQKDEGPYRARILMALINAYEINAPSFASPANDWKATAQVALGKILASQAADGTYPAQMTCGASAPWSVGMVNSALIEYYEKVDRDPRILPAAKKSIDQMWASEWVAASRAFRYLPIDCNGEGQTPAPDLNALIAPGFGWVYSLTGDAVYRDRGDLMLEGAVTQAYYQGTRQFNQMFTSSYRYLDYREK